VPKPEPSIPRELLPALPAALLFFWIALSVSHSAILPVDSAVRGWVNSWASVPLTEAMKVVTDFGSGWFLWPFGALICLRLIREGRRREAALFAAAAVGANLLEQAAKMLFHRARPEPFFGYEKPISYSFPSGHAFVSFCFYLVLAELLIEPEWVRQRRIAIWTLAILMVLSIGLSRIYLGVHYPTDVLGGYAGAFAWTVVVRAAHRRWWRTGDRTPEDATP